MDGLELLEKMYQSKMRTKVILLTMHREVSIYKRANEIGVYGYLLKNHSESELEQCIQSVINNKQYISPLISNELVLDTIEKNDDVYSNLTLTEKKVLEMVGRQYNTKQIAKLLFIAEKQLNGTEEILLKNWDYPRRKMLYYIGH